MEDNEIDQNKNISGLSFKHLLSSENIPENESGEEGYLFLDDDIEKKTVFSKFKERVHKFFRKSRGKKNLFSFLISFITYLYSRARIIWILSSVLIDLIVSGLDFFKEKFVKRMFWGRGGFLKSTLQILFVIVVVILTVSYIYRKPVVIEASSDTLDSIGVAETDVLVMNATVNTLIPKERERRYVETYTVKGGDSLSKIASSYDIKVETLLWANNLNSKSIIKPGMVLQVPPMDGVLVKIKKGDTVESLAKKYSARTADIVDHNWLEKPYTLAVGDTIFIPDGEPPVVKPTYASSPSSFYKSSSVSYNS
ncbi:MAG: LysM peptidoglycan-binding domain-containing protein, partial [Candidatus Dojkabacteria bacterium]|nr:LysM peptidoglycan-binding domain-containing protein [Candidatus Dojkabacteria bacterium]